VCGQRGPDRDHVARLHHRVVPQLVPTDADRGGPTARMHLRGGRATFCSSRSELLFSPQPFPLSSPGIPGRNVSCAPVLCLSSVSWPCVAQSVSLSVSELLFSPQPFPGAQSLPRVQARAWHDTRHLNILNPNRMVALRAEFDGVHRHHAQLRGRTQPVARSH
jgi:hypothetical protein